MGERQRVLVVLDWSLPLEEEPPGTYDALGQRRASVGREVIRRLGDSVAQVVLYSEVARVGAVSDLDARVTFDLVYGSNLQHALRLAREGCEASAASRAVLITSSTPSAHLQPSGESFFCFPPARETLQVTANEICELARADLRIDTLVVGGYGGEPHDRLVVLAALMQDLTEPLDGCVVVSEEDEPTTIVVDRFLTASGLSS